MGQSSQAGFNSTDNNRRGLIGVANQITIYNRSVVRPVPHDTARGIHVIISSFFRYGIMIHHGIHISCGNKKTKFWCSQNRYRCIIFPVRLRNNANRIAVCLKNSGNNGMTKGWMVNIGIAANVDKVQLFDTPFFHILFTDWQKTIVHKLFLLVSFL